jgi:predicted ATP-grasp superfamily ATP-dependent carboligase
VRILVHEFVSGGGYAGRGVPSSLVREGAAIRAALLDDLAAIGQHDIVTTADDRFPVVARTGIEVVTVRAGRSPLPDALIASADAVWLIAPEIDRCLERLSARVDRNHRRLIGSGTAAIRRASDKADLARRLARYDVPHPETRVVASASEASTKARELGYPIVIKPRRGAGCLGVCLVRSARDVAAAFRAADRASGSGALLQRYVRGTPASVSLIANGRRAVALCVNAQSVRASRPFSYHGGSTPLAHSLARRAIDVAVRACAAVGGLRGWVGVDLVLTESEAVVIEVNARLTTAYLGVRSAVRGAAGDGANLAALAIAASAGAQPAPPRLRRHVRFTAGGRVVVAT